jgi:murein DD-endopeptidase MepM/ murein hydrolase activator NlpD
MTLGKLRLGLLRSPVRLSAATLVAALAAACAREPLPTTESVVASVPEPPPTPSLKPQGIGTAEALPEPVMAELAPDWPYAPRPTDRAAFAPQPSLQGVDIAALPPSAPAPGPEPAKYTGPRYTVRPGETVYGISRRLNVPIRALIDANRLQPPYALRIGQRLIVPLPRRHVVQAGETVYGISRVYGVDMSELVRMNKIEPPYTIAVDQELVLPAQVRAPLSPNPPAPRSQVVVPPEPVLEPLRVLDPETPPPVEVASAKTAQATADAEVAGDTPPAGDAPVAPKETAALAPSAASSDARFLWPVRGEVLSGFGPKDSGLHNDGINIAAPRGSVVRAAADGVVAYAGNELRGFGQTVLIKHADGWVTAYAHNETILVERGDRVQKGQVIARVGSTGDVTTPQLHFELRNGSRAVDPLQHMSPQDVPG